MHGEELSSTLLIEVAGSRLPDTVVALLNTWVFDDSVTVPDLFWLRFSDDGSGVLDKAGLRIGVGIRLLIQSSGSSAPAQLMSGEVTAVETEIGPDGMHTVVRGLDHSHRLFRGRRVEVYVQSTAADIARTVAQRAGLKAGRIDHPGPVLAHVGQEGVSDWDFLRRLALDVGATVAVHDGALDFTTSTAADSAPHDGQGSRQDPLVLEQGVNLIALRACVTAADQVPEVEVRGWDVEAKKALVSVQSSATRSASLRAVAPADLAATFASPRWIESGSGYTSQQQCDAAAKALADRLAGSFAELDGVVRGNPAMRAGTAVSLTKVGRPFAGQYVLSSTRHEYSHEAGYTTSFVVSNSSERSLYGVAAGGSTGTSPGDGVLTATVTDVSDPDGRGRVKISFPVMSESYVSWWARTVQLGAGAGRGWTVLPEVGDEVLVAFGMGRFNEPYVLGGLYNGQDKPTVAWNDHVDGTDGSVTRRAFVSRTGMTIDMRESAQEAKLTLSTNDGAQRITLVQKSDAAIQIVSEGPVEITAKKDVSVSTTGGDVTVKGKKISLSASGDLELSGMNVTVSAQSAAEMKGMTVKVSGDTTAELSASAATTVKGLPVRIN